MIPFTNFCFFAFSWLGDFKPNSARLCRFSPEDGRITRNHRRVGCRDVLASHHFSWQVRTRAQNIGYVKSHFNAADPDLPQIR
ncbi:MAG TPA: hypothetical protein VFG49_05820, partial [Dyella sp.]|uniref:hypothetical protein n=1 Tax=Dyella sp. TaxID=1869338 RepID=UPI002D78659B